MKKILVVGSLNMDTTIEVPHMPKPGETLSGKSIRLVPGGKGANQAYAAGKLGGRVTMAGAVGDDSFGQALRENLEKVGVSTEPVEVLSGVPTGQAYITVDESGENSIIIIAGTNGEVTPAMAGQWTASLEEADIVLLQFEIPLETVQYVKERAVELGKTVIVDPAPARTDVPEEFWKGISYIKPNETELAILTGKEAATREELCRGAKEMLEKGVENVLVTLGGDGCLLVNRDTEEFFPAEKVKAVDTTAAGDCFTAAFALGLARGWEVREAIAFGQKASAIAVTRKGAQSSVPDASEIS